VILMEEAWQLAYFQERHPHVELSTEPFRAEPARTTK